MTLESHLRLTPRETDLLGLKRKLDLAKGIIEKGGRPSIVRAVCQISKASALQFHKEIHGERAKAGQLPYDQDWIVKSPQNCLHASIYFNIFQTLSKVKNCKTNEIDRKNPITAEIVEASKHATKGEIFLSSYNLYEQVVGSHLNVLSINRAWHIGQQFAMSYITPMTCSRCNSTYVSIRNYPDVYKFCPLCDSAIDITGRQKWKLPNLNGSNKNANDIFSNYVFHSEAL